MPDRSSVARTVAVTVAGLVDVSTGPGPMATERIKGVGIPGLVWVKPGGAPIEARLAPYVESSLPIASRTLFHDGRHFLGVPCR